MLLRRLGVVLLLIDVGRSASLLVAAAKLGPKLKKAGLGI